MIHQKFFHLAATTWLLSLYKHVFYFKLDGLLRNPSLFLKIKTILIKFKQRSFLAHYTLQSGEKGLVTAFDYLDF